MQITLGPPYTGFRMVQYFPLPGDGLWAVARINPSTGQVVLQAGANAPQAQPEGIDAAAGFEMDIVPNVTGTYTFSFNLAVGPLSLLPRGAYTMEATIRTFISPPGPSNLPQFIDSARTGEGFVGRYYAPRTATVQANLTKGAKYKLSMLSDIYMDYPGLPNPAPYAEIIATYQHTVEMTPQAAAVQAAEEPDRFAKHLDRVARKAREVTDQEMASSGWFELK